MHASPRTSDSHQCKLASEQEHSSQQSAAAPLRLHSSVHMGKNSRDHSHQLVEKHECAQEQPLSTQCNNEVHPEQGASVDQQQQMFRTFLNPTGSTPNVNLNDHCRKISAVQMQRQEKAGSLPTALTARNKHCVWLLNDRWSTVRSCCAVIECGSLCQFRFGLNLAMKCQMT